MLTKLVTNISYGDHTGFAHINPEQWKTEHVRLWLDWAMSQYGLRRTDNGRLEGGGASQVGGVNVDKLQYLSGMDLCKMSQEDFQRLTGSEQAGDLLYCHLNCVRSKFKAGGKLYAITYDLH